MTSLPPPLALACGLAVASATEPVPPPPLEVLPQDILSSRTVFDGKRHVTLQELDPAAMADRLAALPPPVADGQPAAAPQAEAEQEPADASAAELPRPTLAFGASVHLPDPAHPERAVTHLQLWNGGQRTTAFWLPVNALWLSGHSSFTPMIPGHSLLLAVSEVSSREGNVPAFSSFSPQGFTVAEGTPTAEDLAAVQALLDFYHRDTPALRAEYEARRARAAAAEAERLAHPPEEKDLLLRYWRTDEAAIRAAREGGAR